MAAVTTALGHICLQMCRRLVVRTLAAQHVRAASSAAAAAAAPVPAAVQSSPRAVSILPPKKPLKPRKRASQLVHPPPQPPLVAEHTVSRSVNVSPPGRMRVASVLGSDAAAALSARMSASGSPPSSSSRHGSNSSRAGQSSSTPGVTAASSGSGSDSEGAIDVAKTTGPAPGGGVADGSSSGTASGSSSGRTPGSGEGASSSSGSLRFSSDSTGAAADSSEGAAQHGAQVDSSGALVTTSGDAQAQGQTGSRGRRRKTRLSELPEAERKQIEARRAALKALALAFPPGVSDSTLFAVVNLGGRQYKVTEGDIINAEKVKGAEVGMALTLPVALVGSRTKTVLGRPLVPSFNVLAAVEEHARDVKVIVFKKKRRKRYQRTQGHRREVTRLRVLAISGDMAAL